MVLGAAAALAESPDIDSPAVGCPSPGPGCMPAALSVLPPSQCGPVASGATCAAQGPATQSDSGGISTGAGNPINLITGNKYQREVDLAALPGVLGLEIVRHYNSAFSLPGQQAGILGRGWRLSYETDLFVRGNSIHVLQADGSRRIFNRDPANPSQCASPDPSHGTIHIRQTVAGNDYTWTWPGGRKLSFNHQGRLVQILAPTGEFVSLQRAPDGRLLKVTDPQGRSLQLKYPDREQRTAGGRYKGVIGIDSPVGEFRYDYGSEMPKGAASNAGSVLANLVRVSLPAYYDGNRKRHPYTDRGVTTSSASRLYHYEDPQHPTLLTGITSSGTVSGGQAMHERIATYAYDASGKGVMSVRGEPQRRDKDGNPVPGTGSDQVTFDRSEPGTTVLTNSLGQMTRYRHAIIGGEHRVLEVRGAGCASCGETNVRYQYDGIGRPVARIKLDDDGKPVHGTRTAFDRSGRMTTASRMQFSGDKAGKPAPLIRYEYAEGTGATSANPYPVRVVRPSVVAGRDHVVHIAYNAMHQPTRIEENGWSQVASEEAVPIHRLTTIEYARINGKSLPVRIKGPYSDRAPADVPDLTSIRYNPESGLPVEVKRVGRDLTSIASRGAGGRPTTIDVSDGATNIRTEQVFTPLGQLRSITRTATNLAAAEGEKGARAEVRHLKIDAPALTDAKPGESQSEAGHTAPDNANLTTAQADAPAQSVPVWYRAGPTGSVLEHDVTEILLAGYGQEKHTVARRWLDDFGRLVGVQNEGQGIRLAAYLGGSARIKTITDGNNNVTAMRYDGEGKLIGFVRSDGGGRLQEQVVLKYAGMRVSDVVRHVPDREAPDSTIRIRRNAFGQPLQELQQIGKLRYAVNHEYDAEGRTIRMWMSVIDAKGSETALPAQYMRHAQAAPGTEQISEIALERWFGRKTVVSAVQWLQGRPYDSGLEAGAGSHATAVATGWKFGNGLRMHARYEQTANAGWPWRLQTYHDGLHSYAITSDSAGRILSASRNGQHSAALQGEAASRNAQGQPAGISPVPAISSSQPLSRRDHARPATDAAGNRLALHDAAGEAELVWDAGGRLIEVRRAGTVVARYQYDARGRRVTKMVGDRPERTRHFIYNDRQLLAETDASGQITRQFIYLGWRPVAWIAPARNWHEKLREFFAGPRIVYLHTDHRGAVTAASDGQKSVLWMGTLDAGGGLTSTDAAARRIEQPLRMVNQYADEETGLHYNLARYYDPRRGEFLSPDPAGIDAGYLDLYAYAGGDLLNHVDPDGWASIRYYAIDDGVKAVKDLQPNQGHWAFVVWDIEGHKDKVLVHDAQGTYLQAGAKARLFTGERSPKNRMGDFSGHYIRRTGLYSPDAFEMEIADADAMGIIRQVTGQDLSTDACIARDVASLPVIAMGNQGTLNPSSRSRTEPNRLIQCDEGLSSDEILLKRVQKAIEIHEVKARNSIASTDQDCASDRYRGCPAITWNPAVRPGTKNIQPASYGWIQFTPPALIEALNGLSPTELAVLGITAAQRAELAETTTSVQRWFNDLAKGSSGRPNAAIVSRGWEENQRDFERQTGLGKENYDRMVSFGEIAANLATVHQRFKAGPDGCKKAACFWDRWRLRDGPEVEGLLQKARSELGASQIALNLYIRSPVSAGEARAGFQWAAIIDTPSGRGLLETLADKRKFDTLARSFLLLKMRQARRRLALTSAETLSSTQEQKLVNEILYLQNGARSYVDGVRPHYNATFCARRDEPAGDGYLRMNRLEWK
jgi:RHS repeat-associated protein